MGNSQKAKLSPPLERELRDIFDLFDVNRSGTIDKDETLKFWWA